MATINTGGWIKTFLATLIAFVVLDALWLTLYAVQMFQREIGAIMRPQPQLWAVGVFYMIYTAALTTLAVIPSAGQGAIAAAGRGALFGLAAYATYDLTNLATITGWTLALALTDMAWGAFGSAAASVAGWIALTRKPRF